MTIQDAIRIARTEKPNQYGDAAMVRWLSDLDGQIYRDVMKGHRGAPKHHSPYRPEKDMGRKLLVQAPYEDIYIKYLCAQVDYLNAEYDRYNNAMMMYNTIYQAYAAFYNRTHLPLQENSIRT